MKYNAKCVVWHKTENGFEPTVYDCWWQDTEAENISKTGSTDVDKAMAHLPIGAAAVKGDYIKVFFGEGTPVGYTSAGDLVRAEQPLKINTVSPKPYGSRDMQHTEVTAR